MKNTLIESMISDNSKIKFKKFNKTNNKLVYVYLIKYKLIGNKIFYEVLCN